ncbi:alpha/beta hydrolase [Segetibacter sp.]|jgi:hypothetical protein|uniref:alpha/beta hydrolase n=1 Tax=Segetibacter sp. TaxID=2231182 RepID=UPI002608E91B|nr:alpha/beta hydrolase [Segetibacter sp.]MCW3081635.1 hypothetical protein [Segetibacter sp.]
MRIFFIPGLGEEIFIFDKIQSSIPGEKIFIDNWSLLTELPEKDLTALVYAKHITEKFQISKEDVVIGHSLGAWVALWVKELSRCRIVQIAGWTDIKKVIKVSPSLSLLYLIAKNGWGLNKLVRVLLSLLYSKEASKAVLLSIFDKLKQADKTTVAKQLMVVYNPISHAPSTNPDLRIHSKKDFIVRPPDEGYAVMKGDHFGLYTFPDTVYKPIVDFLARS